MDRNKLLFIIILFILVLSFRFRQQLPMQTQTTPTPTPFTQYTVPTIPNKKNIEVFFVGDSMTLALGPHPAHFSFLMNEKFDKIFAIDNYAEGSRSILSLEELLTKKTNINGLIEKPALERAFDIFVIESFGHNPLSQFPLEEGLRKQEAILDEMMIKLIEKRPQAVIIFLATIAPDPQNYAAGVLDLSSQSRLDFATERNAYIENFIQYAEAHHIPLVNVYAQSFNADGSFRRELINPDDNIHPSQFGIELIQKQIFEFIVANNYLGS